MNLSRWRRALSIPPRLPSGSTPATVARLSFSGGAEDRDARLIPFLIAASSVPG